MTTSKVRSRSPTMELGGQDWGFALAHNALGPPDGVGGDDLQADITGDQPVEQLIQSRQVLLDGGLSAPAASRLAT